MTIYYSLSLFHIWKLSNFKSTYAPFGLFIHLNQELYSGTRIQETQWIILTYSGFCLLHQLTCVRQAILPYPSKCKCKDRRRTHHTYVRTYIRSKSGWRSCGPDSTAFIYVRSVRREDRREPTTLVCSNQHSPDQPTNQPMVPNYSHIHLG